MNWRRGRFKENSRCVRCRKFLRRVGKICDECIIDVYLESLITGRNLREICRELGIFPTNLSKRLREIRMRGEVEELIAKNIYRRLKKKREAEGNSVRR